MGSILRSFFQSLMKMFNAIVGMAGIAMVLYSLWMIHVWHKQTGYSPFDDDYPAPWFIYTFLGIGILFCVITCSGHIAAETLSGCCLYIYMLLMFPLLVLEGVLIADVFLNRKWEQDFPGDETGNFYQLENFLRENFDFCKWIGLTILVAQGIALLLGVVLKALGPIRERNYESDEEYSVVRRPFLTNSVEPSPYVVVDPIYGAKK